MSKSIVAVLALLAAILFAPTPASAICVEGCVVVGNSATPSSNPAGHHGSTVAPWIVIGCVSGTVLSAMVANARDNRELTFREAAFCGIQFSFARPVFAGNKKKNGHGYG